MMYRLAFLPTNGAPDKFTNMAVPHYFGPAETSQSSTRSNFLPVFPDLPGRIGGGSMASADYCGAAPMD